MAIESSSKFGPAFLGWHSYEKFASSVISENRYFRNMSDAAMFEVIRKSCGERRVHIPRGTLYWRARLGYEVEDVIVNIDEQSSVSYGDERPYSQVAMKPVPTWETEGRANPRGIPYLYISTTRETALAEVRPWIGSKISVAQFQTTRDMNLIDCSKYHSKVDIGKLLDNSSTHEDGVWLAIDQAFARPVSRGDESSQYIPTQIIAEMFKHDGYDGIAYKSLLTNDGFNVALFNISDAEPINCTLYKTESIRHEFEPAGPEYFVQAPQISRADPD